MKDSEGDTSASDRQGLPEPKRVKTKESDDYKLENRAPIRTHGVCAKYE